MAFSSAKVIDHFWCAILKGENYLVDNQVTGIMNKTETRRKQDSLFLYDLIIVLKDTDRIDKGR